MRQFIIIFTLIIFLMTLAGCMTDNADDDKDGVINSWDQCPDTAMGSPVDGDGCPVDCPDLADADQDGVPDVWDECADTPSGTPTDKIGCPNIRVVVIPGD